MCLFKRVYFLFSFPISSSVIGQLASGSCTTVGNLDNSNFSQITTMDYYD